MHGNLRYGTVQRSAAVQCTGARAAYALPAQTAEAPRLDLRASIDSLALDWAVDPGPTLRTAVPKVSHGCAFDSVYGILIHAVHVCPCSLFMIAKSKCCFYGSGGRKAEARGSILVRGRLHERCAASGS